MTSSNDDEAVQLLLSRIDAIEKSSWTTKQLNDEVKITPQMRRARRHVETSHCYSSQWKLCPSNYYTLTLDERKVILGAENISQLCKACLFENKNYKPTDNSGGNGSAAVAVDPTNSQYYLVVVQYVESIDMKKLASELRGLRPSGPTRLDPNYFSDLRLAPEDVSETLTGYGHNGVSPFGMIDSTIPVIVCKSIVENVMPKFIWMGGGDKDWKLGMAVTEFVAALNAIVLDVSEPRTLLQVGGTNCNTVP
jgi:prolyl-tRNA editing enzyme YbaK/EbsC (Cys-tRNA(Pro) deacylase)